MFPLCFELYAQSSTSYFGAEITGQLTLVRTVNALQQAQSDALRTPTFAALAARSYDLRELPKFPRLPHPPVLKLASRTLTQNTASNAVLGVVVAPATAGFNGITHAEQRLANRGNQFSVEPPSPGVAVANGFVLEGVNNAIQVYDMSGKALLPVVLATNELFGVAPAIDRTTGANGVFPTDLRVFFDPDINRWFVLQRSQDNDIFGTPLNSSHLYMAVSQAGDPTGTYNVYVADTTNFPANPGCPCLEDYLQIGADQYGFYISADEYNTAALSFVDATIWAISKASLQSGASVPTAYKFTLPNLTGYEFAVQPATTPPHASYFLGAGGVEYFASTVFTFSTGNAVAIYAMSNTSSLATTHPAPRLVQTIVPTFSYAFPDVAVQPDGPRPYGASIGSFAPLPFIDGGDTRALSLSYAGGRLYLTFATAAADGNGRTVVGGAYTIFSPTFRNNVLNAPVLRETYLVVNDRHLLRPSVAVNSQGQGAIAVTLVGQQLYASAAFVRIDSPFVTPSTIQIAALGALPEDGFTGYSGSDLPAVARWGDYSAAVTADDGSSWMTVEYIGQLPRTPLANWDTFLFQNKP
jgi:hypothetical protein